MSQMNNDLIILMTATITPNTFKTLALTDPDIRKKQYIEAITYYLTYTNFKIVFTENSGESLKKYFDSDKKRLEFITYKSMETYPDVGKGAKEFELISYALKHSKLIKKNSGIIKITGRLLVLNIDKLSEAFHKDMIENNSIFSCNIYKIGKMDARCFYFSFNFWSFFIERGKSVSINYSIESAMWDAMLDLTKQDYSYKQLKQSLRIKGINAGFGSTYNHDYLTTILKRTRYLFLKPFYYRAIEKILMPKKELK